MSFVDKVTYCVIKIYFVCSRKKITENKNEFTKITYIQLRHNAIYR